MPESAPGGLSAPGGVWSRGGLVPGGSGLGGCLVRGVSAPGEIWSGGGSASVPSGIPPPPPVNRMTNRCKNITLATTSLRPVTK